MAFREVAVTEIREALRAWLDGAGLRTVAERAGVDRKTARRYVEAAVSAGLSRDGGRASSLTSCSAWSRGWSGRCGRAGTAARGMRWKYAAAAIHGQHVTYQACIWHKQPFTQQCSGLLQALTHAERRGGLAPSPAESDEYLEVLAILPIPARPPPVPRLPVAARRTPGSVPRPC